MKYTCKSVVFDVDSTLVTCEGLDMFAAFALSENPEKERIVKEIEYITQLGMNGEIPLEEGFRRRIQLLSATKSQVVLFSKEIINFISPTVLNNLNFFKENNSSIYVVSGGFIDFVLPIVNFLGISHDNIMANEFIYDDKENIVGVADKPTSKKFGKATAVSGFGLDRPILMVGDGYTDYEVKLQGAADIFAAYTETVRREKVCLNANFEVDSFDELLSKISVR